MTTYNLFLITVTTLILCGTNEIQAQERHPFVGDLKNSYKALQLPYDAKVESLLFSKLPKPSNEFERYTGSVWELPKPKSAKAETIIDLTVEALFRQFFRRVKKGENYCPVSEIKKQFGQTPQERISISSGGYYRLFVAYWTLKAKLDSHKEANVKRYGYANVQYLDALLSFVESTLAGAFFPSPGAVEIPESQRRQGIQEMLKAFAPGMTIKELYEGADPEKVRWPILK